MSIFSFFNRIKEVHCNKNEHSDEQKQWDKMWDMWVKGEADSPYAELMTYQSEVENGGHDQYFFNIENTGDLQKEMTILCSILPEKSQRNFQEAYNAWLVLDKEERDSKAEAILEQCDDEFYKREEEINAILKGYASKIVLHT